MKNRGLSNQNWVLKDAVMPLLLQLFGLSRHCKFTSSSSPVIVDIMTFALATAVVSSGSRGKLLHKLLFSPASLATTYPPEAAGVESCQVFM